MRNIKLIIDDCANIPIELKNEMDIHSMPLYYSFDEKEYNVHDLSVDQFITKINEAQKISTSQVNILEIENTFEKYLKSGFDLIYVALSSGISGTFQNAAIISKQLLEKYKDAKIVLIDSKGGEGGHGLIALKAWNLIKSGMKIEDIEKELNYLVDHIVYNFVVTDFKFLLKNGRINSMAAAAGTMLKIRPVLEMSKEGKIVSAHKALGMNKAVLYMLQKLKDDIDYEKTDVIYITELLTEKDSKTNEVTKAYNSLYEKTKELVGDNATIYKGSLNPIIASHTGPNTIAIFYFKK